MSASVRNFGFVTVTGQADGDTRRRALRSREVWVEVAAEAGIDVLQRGAVIAARREEALAVLVEFAAGPMGAGCELLSAREVAKRLPCVRGDCAGALASPHELRIEARDALPRLALWLEARHGVAFTWGSAALGVEPAGLRHARGLVAGGAIVIAAGAGLAHLPPRLSAPAAVVPSPPSLRGGLASSRPPARAARGRTGSNPPPRPRTAENPSRLPLSQPR